jgi:hypothetical protein
LRSELAISMQPVRFAVAHRIGGMTIEPGWIAAVEPLLVTSPLVTAPSVASTASASWKRWEGSADRQRRIRSSRDFGNPRRTCAGGRGLPSRIAMHTSGKLFPGKGRLPVLMWYSTDPSAKMSDRASSSSPRTCSGDM